MRLNVFFCFALVLNFQISNYAQNKVYTAIIIDSLGNEIELVKDANDFPLTYTSNVLTPVCLDGTCYPIRINLHWNMAGEYLSYSMDENEILTKIDHIPFTKQDYVDLDLVIRDNGSALADFTLEELTTTDTTAELADSIKVDGVTGATRTELEGAFVPGALFTSHTLWHLVRRPSMAMRKYTKTHFFKKQYESYFLSQPALGLQREYLMHMLKNVDQTITLLAPIIDSTDNELTVHAIELIAENELNQSACVTVLSQKYENTSNAQVKATILMKWQNRTISLAEQLALTKELGTSFSTFMDELKVLEAQDNWGEQVYFEFYERMKSTPNMMRKEKMKKVLRSKSDTFPKKFRKVLKKEGIVL